MSEKRVWLITDEFDADCPSVYNCYPNITEAERDEIVRQMKRYSSYDYCTYDEYETEDEYVFHVEHLKCMSVGIVFDKTQLQ